MTAVARAAEGAEEETKPWGRKQGEMPSFASRSLRAGPAAIGPPEWEKLPKTLAASGDVRPLQGSRYAPGHSLLPNSGYFTTSGFRCLCTP